MFLLLAACSRFSNPESTEATQTPQEGRSVEVRDPDAVSRTISLTEYWFDGDRDGFGAPGTKLWATERPRRYVAVGRDCDDRDATVNPDATEVEANGVDDDCDRTIDEVEADTGDTASDSGTTDTSSSDTAVVDTAGTDSGDTSTDTSATDTGDTADTAVVASTGILVSRDTTDGLTYPATIYAWYGSSTTAQLEVNSASATLNFAPSDAELSDHSWVDIQASWSSGANWSDDCGGFSVSSSDYAVALYEHSVGGGSSDTCRIYVGLAVPSGSDVGAWTLVP